MVIDDANVSVCNAMSESVKKHQSMHHSHAGGHTHDVYDIMAHDVYANIANDSS